MSISTTSMFQAADENAVADCRAAGRSCACDLTSVAVAHATSEVEFDARRFRRSLRCLGLRPVLQQHPGTSVFRSDVTQQIQQPVGSLRGMSVQVRRGSAENEGIEDQSARIREGFRFKNYPGQSWKNCTPATRTENGMSRATPWRATRRPCLPRVLRQPRLGRLNSYSFNRLSISAGVCVRRLAHRRSPSGNGCSVARSRDFLNAIGFPTLA